MRVLWKYIRPHAPSMALGLFIKLLASVIELFIPTALARIVDEASGPEDLPTVLFWGGVMLLCAVGALLGNIIANRYTAVTAGRVTRRLRRDLFDKILSLSARQVDEMTVPSLISRLTSDTYVVNNFLVRIQRIGVRAPILLLGGIAITLSMNPIMTLVLVALLPFIALFTYLITKRGVPLYRRQQEVLDDVVRIVQENASGVRVVKALSRTEYERDRFEERSLTLSATEERASRTMGLSGPVNSLILNLGLCGVLVVGGYLLDGGNATPGTILAFLNYFTLILNAMTAITRVFVMTSRGMASAGRVAAVLTLPPDLEVLPEETEETEEAERGKGNGEAQHAPHIAFEDVSFSYNGVRSDLSHVSFQLFRGQTLGIIGATGAGKTTLISLLMRFYDVTEGQILIDGRDVRTLPKEELYRKFGVALQNDFLRMGTIEDNLDFDRGLLSEELHAAAVTACAEEFIAGKEEGMAHMLTLGGANLSGGQRQRLFVGRAVASRPEILILDDSSSALDYKTESRLRANLAERMAGVTKVVVAQRVSALRHADRILLLEEGRVIADGTHEELMERSEVYREIALTQMGGDFDA